MQLCEELFIYAPAQAPRNNVHAILAINDNLSLLLLHFKREQAQIELRRNLVA
jgi:hypothetical protein